MHKLLLHKFPAVKPKCPSIKEEAVEEPEVTNEEEDEAKEATDEDEERVTNQIEEKVIRMSKYPRVFYVGSDSSSTTSVGE